jgi:uncharacterized damage-inducible protein DinB
MHEKDRIIEQLRRSIDGDAWHGPSVFETLKGLSVEQTAARPIAAAHTIWEILLHITVWIEQVRGRLRGDNTKRDLPPDQDWPAQPKRPDDTAWQALQDRLRHAHEAFALDINKLDDSRLDQPILEGMSSVYVSLHGVVQHNLYHAGQIAILRKVL